MQHEFPSRGHERGGGLSRRSLLQGLTAGLVLAACGASKSGSGDSASTSLPTTDGSATASRALRAAFPFSGGYLVPEVEQRLVFVLVDQEGVVDRDAPNEVRFAISSADDPGTEAASVTAPLRNEAIPRPYYAVPFTPPRAGIYTVAADVGDERLEASFTVSPRDEVPIPQPGDPLKPVDTPTVEDPMGVDPLCTREPPCPFHDVSLAEALASDDPVAFVISTPAFCQVGICGPTLDLVVDASEDLATITYVHTEVYKNAERVEDLASADLVDAVKFYGLSFEPSLFLVDRDGILRRRLDFVWDASELREALGEITV